LCKRRLHVLILYYSILNIQHKSSVESLLSKNKISISIFSIFTFMRIDSWQLACIRVEGEVAWDGDLIINNLTAIAIIDIQDLVRPGIIL
jgi:hypothetical protein